MQSNIRTYEPDSCLITWTDFYRVVYKDFLDGIFDFSRLYDNCGKISRFYVMMDKGKRKESCYPRFKIAGDCIFNFNEKKDERYQRIIEKGDEELLKRLDKCCRKHHSFVNFALLPMTGGMNNQKQEGKKIFGDRPDVQLAEIDKFYKGKETKIFNYCRSEKAKEGLKWYLGLFGSVEKYCEEVLLVNGKKWSSKMLEFSEKTIDENTVSEYLTLALDFWEERENYIKEKYPEAEFSNNKTNN